MKLIKNRNFSLQFKLTFLCTLILVCIAAGSTLLSILNVDRFFIRDGMKNVSTTAATLITPPGSSPVEEETSYTIKASSNISDNAPAQSNTLTITDAPFSEPQVTATFAPSAVVTISAPFANQSMAEKSVLGALYPPIQVDVQATVLPMFVQKVNSMIVTSQSHFNYSTLWIMAALVALGFLLIFFVTGRALRPLSRLSEKMRLMNENSLSDHLEETFSSKEINQLTDSFNRLLDRLDSAFAAQKQFTAAAAHELKTPLACIQTNLEVLAMGPPPTLEEFQESAQITRRNTQRLIHLVDELLDMNRPVRMNHMETIFLSDLVEQAVSELRPKIEEKEITVRCACRGVLTGDTSMLYRMLYNLIENAVKYNKQGGTVTVCSQEEDSRLILLISDTGPGIPDPAKEEIFQPFFRLDKSRSRKIAGAGLGLSIVKSIVERHGGNIAVYNRKGGGSIFQIIFYHTLISGTSR